MVGIFINISIYGHEKSHTLIRKYTLKHKFVIPVCNVLLEFYKICLRMVNYINDVSGQQVEGKNENHDGMSEKYLAAIIVLVILLVISCAVIVCLFYQTRVKLPSTESKPETTNDETNSRNIYDVPLNNYENVEDDHSTYTALKRPALRETGDDHVYGHLNQVIKNVPKNQGETGF